MFERFSERAKKVMLLANQEAQRFRHEAIDTEHILLGLMKEGAGIGSYALKDLHLDLLRIRQEVEKLVQRGPDAACQDKITQAPGARKVIECALDEARHLNHNYVGTEHLLLGLLRETDGVAARVLTNFNLRLESVREEVVKLLDADIPSANG